MAAKLPKDQEFVEYIVKALVDNPDKVKTTRSIDEMGVLITLDIDPADMGQVIGRQGQTAKSIRTLLRVVGAKNNARVNLKIKEPEGGRRPAKKSAAESGDMVEDLKL
jgi:predicted RNA-binding protein YlqC (UPF0109 family)